MSARPAAPEPRPGFALFVVTFLLSPLVLVCWAAAQGVIRVTGWPRWRVGAAAAASGALVIWPQGGPAEGKSPKEALRCLKRRLSDAVYRCLVTDQPEQPPAMVTSNCGPSACDRWIAPATSRP
jgi:hypothetical protein